MARGSKSSKEGGGGNGGRIRGRNSREVVRKKSTRNEPGLK